MRDIPDPPFTGWDPPDYHVDVDVHGKVVGAVPGAQHNWGRFGDLATDCAADGVYEGFFVAAPMPVVGASGSPLNPIFVK